MLFSIVDDHAHVVVVAAGRGFAAIGRSLRLALLPRASASLSQPHIKPIESRSHLENLLRYLLRQVDHHGLDTHPALWSGSCFQDLAGARHLPGLSPRLQRLLPRVKLHDVCDIVGLAGPPLRLDDRRIRGLGAMRITAAAASVHAADPEMNGRRQPIVLARQTAIRLADQCGVSSAEIEWALRLTARGRRKLRSRPLDPRFIRAAERRLALEEAVIRPTGTISPR